MYYSHFFLQWWTSTHVKFISTQCASSLFSSSAWVSSCCCYPRTGTSASSSSAQSCANVTSQLRAAQRRVLPQGSTGEGEPGPPCQHLHIDSMKHHDTMQTHHTQTEGGRHTLVSILGRVTRLVTCPLFHAAPWVKKRISDCSLTSNISSRRGGTDCVSFIWCPFHSDVIRVGAWTCDGCNPSYPKKWSGLTDWVMYYSLLNL